ncbi:anaphase-promoting complex subunit cdc27, partial [Coemansia furcata]
MRTNRVAQSEAHSLEAVRRNQLQWSACRRLCELGYAGQISEALAVDLGDVTERAALRRQADAVLESTPVPASRLASRIQGPTTAMAQLKPGLVVAAAKNSASQLRQPGRPGDEPASARGSTRSRTLAKPVVAPVAATLAVSAGGRARATLGQKNMAMKTPGRPRVDVLVGGSDKKRTRNGSAIRSASVGRVGEPTLGAGAVRSGGGGSVDGAALAHMHGLIGRKADVYAHMCAYRAGQGLASFAGVAVEQQNSAWGLCVLGRICFEAGRYPEAARAFAAAHVLAPYRVRDMDVYSTLLWHMRREEDLAQLAHAMVQAGRGWSPEAWVAVANCFSLEGDHASAQRSLGRSIQLYAAGAVPRSDSGGVAGLAYAHTLVGHESVAAGDEAERAQQAFRTAMRIDGRHYNAWYGLGMVYLRQGRLELAEYHFKRALALNTQNPLLLQSAGALLEARGDYAGALAVYERVLSSGDVAADDDGDAPHHALSFVLFKRARVLV